jgi:dethiobiotin synthase
VFSTTEACSTFITGTDTGVGKTLITALMLQHLRVSGVRALAIKPFCSGGLQDTRLLREIQERELSCAEISPFSFRRAWAPYFAARHQHQTVRMEQAVDHVRAIAKRCDRLLVEGAGGLLVPLGEGFHVLDLLKSVSRKIVLVAANRLGVLNHTLLSIRELKRSVGYQCELRIALVEHSRSSELHRLNAEFLTQAAAPHRVVRVPWLGNNASTVAKIQKATKILSRCIAQLCE